MTEVDGIPEAAPERLQRKGIAIERSLNYLAEELKRIGLYDPAEIVTAASQGIAQSLRAQRTARCPDDGIGH